MLTLSSTKDRYELDSLHDALIMWYAENSLSLDPEDVKGRIFRDEHAEGVDALLVDSANNDLLFVQAKTVDKFENRTNNYAENDVKLALEGVKFLLRGDYKGKITPCLENLVDEYHELDRTEDYRTRVLFLHLKQPPVSCKFVDLFTQEIPQVKVDFLDFHWFFSFYRDVYLAKTAAPPKRVSFRIMTNCLTKKVPYPSRVFTTKAEDLARVYDEHGERIFQQNVRYFLGLRSKAINQRILETAIGEEGANFWYFNNGVTMVCTKITETTAGNVVKLEDPQIINGAQTTYALHEAYKTGKLKDENEVLVKAIETTDRDFMESVTLYTNSQNAIRLRDLCSNDKTQRAVQKILLDSYGYFYERKRGEFDTLYPTPAAKESAFGSGYKSKLISNENAAQAFLAAYLLKPSQAKAEKARIFLRDSGGLYAEIFDDNDTLLPEKLLMSWKLLKFAEAQKAAYAGLYAQAKDAAEATKVSTYRFDFLLHSEYFITNLLTDFLKNRGFDIHQNKSHILKVISAVDSSDAELAADYTAITVDMAEFMDELKQEQSYYHNKFFKSDKSIALVRNFLRKKHPFVEIIQQETPAKTKCPVCGKAATGVMNLAKHFLALSDAKHVEWIESKGLSYPKLLGSTQAGLGKGDLQPLADRLKEELGA